MITPRRTRLVRVAGLRAFRDAVARLAADGDLAPGSGPATDDDPTRDDGDARHGDGAHARGHDPATGPDGARGRAWRRHPAAARARAVLVPSVAAAEQLRRAIEDRTGTPEAGAPPAVVVLPDLVTRDAWYAELHRRLGDAPRRLSDVERGVIAAAAARDARAAGADPPFATRPGLLAAVLEFYDAVRRHRRTIDDVERLVVSDLEPRVAIDRGAERMLRQTRFLVAMLRAYEARCEASGAIDEHGLRTRLLETVADRPYRHVVVAVGDRQSDPPGLWDADFDLLTRLPGLEAIDVVATEGVLAAGFAERVRAFLPGLEEAVAAVPAMPPPQLVVPSGASPARHVTVRDREAELADTARAIKAAAAAGQPCPLDRIGVVFRRPLPYVYLARSVFESAGVPYEATDALPLAAEPYAAAVDLVCSAVSTGFAREPLVALLRSPHFDLAGAGRAPTDPRTRRAIAALDAALEAHGFLGGRDALAALAAGWAGETRELAGAALAAIDELAPLAGPAPASELVARLDGFLRARERLAVPDGEAWRARHLRARGAILGALADLAAAFHAHDDPPMTIADLAATVRRWMESKTFAPRAGGGGVQLLDAAAAAFADLDDLHVLGLVGGEWPGRADRHIFYPAFLLGQLGWPSDAARLGATRAAFADLLRSPSRRITVSAFVLEDDALVEPSPLLEELDRSGLALVEAPWAGAPLVLREEALARRPARLDAVTGVAAEWAACRAGRPASDWRRFRGWAGGAGLGSYRVSALDRYLDCPFRYFASEVLAIPEPDEAGEGFSRRDEGRFVHEVLRAFFDEWRLDGSRGIAPESLDEARAAFARVAERELARVSAADRRQARATLAGTAVSPGVAEIVLGAEAASRDVVIDRWLEHDLDGEYPISDGLRTRTLGLRARADRIDLLDGHRFRVIDYKLGRADSATRAIQLPAYVVAAAAQLAARHGGRWEVAEALYLAFGRRDAVRTVMPRAGAADPLRDGQARMLDAVGGIERGEFPPRPSSLAICRHCGYARLCRKEYVGDIDADAAV